MRIVVRGRREQPARITYTTTAKGLLNSQRRVTSVVGANAGNPFTMPPGKQKYVLLRNLKNK